MVQIDIKRALEITDILKNVSEPSFFHYNNLITQKLQEALHSKIGVRNEEGFSTFERRDMNNTYLNMCCEDEMFKQDDNWCFGRITAPSDVEEINRCGGFLYSIDHFYFFYESLELICDEYLMGELVQKAEESYQAAETFIVEKSKDKTAEFASNIFETGFFLLLGEDFSDDEEYEDALLLYGMYGALYLYYYMNNKEFPYESRLEYFYSVINPDSYINIVDYLEHMLKELESYFVVQGFMKRCPENETYIRFLASSIMNCMFSSYSNQGDGYTSKLVIISSKTLGEYMLLKDTVDKLDDYNKQLLDSLNWLYNEITHPMGFTGCGDFMATRAGEIGVMDSFLCDDLVYIVLHYAPYELEYGLYISGFLESSVKNGTEGRIENVEERRRANFDFTYRLKTELFDSLFEELKARLPVKEPLSAA